LRRFPGARLADPLFPLVSDLGTDSAIRITIAVLKIFLSGVLPMKKVLSSVVAALVAVAFAGVVFAADATPAAAPAGEVKKEEKAEKAPAKKSKKAKKAKHAKKAKKAEKKEVAPAAEPAAPAAPAAK
jgi:ribosomal protein L12E/L44/L45/RPP1/RPP2